MPTVPFRQLEAPTVQESLYDALDAYTAPSTWEGIKASLSTGLAGTVLREGADIVASEVLPVTDAKWGQKLSADEANRLFEPPTDFTEDTTYIDAHLATDRQRHLLQQQAIIEASGIPSWLKTVSTFAGGMADPVSLLAGAGIGAGVTKVGTLLASKSSLGIATKLGRLLMGAKDASKAAMLGRELVETAVGVALLDIPTTEIAGDIYQEDRGWQEHAFSLATGTAAGFLGRYIGNRFLSSDAARNFDSDTNARAAMNSVMESMETGRAPDIEAKLNDWAGQIYKHATDNTNIVRVAQELEVDPSPTIHYAALTTDQVDFTKHARRGQAIIGADLGSGGMHLVNNPAMAEARLLGKTSGIIAAIDIGDMRLMDIGTPTPALMKHISDQLEGIIPARELDAVRSSLTLKEAFDKIASLGQEDDAVFSVIHTAMREQGYDGYRYKEDVFNSHRIDDALEGESMYIFDPSAASVVKHVDANLEAGNASMYKRLQAEYKEPPTEYDARMLEQRHDTEYKNDSPVFHEKDFANVYAEVFDPKRQAPDMIPEHLVAETQAKAKELLEAIELEAITPEEQQLARGLRKIIEDGVTNIEQYDKVVKAAILCIKRNG